MWDVIVSFPDHCLSVYSTLIYLTNVAHIRYAPYFSFLATSFVTIKRYRSNK